MPEGDSERTQFDLMGVLPCQAVVAPATSPPDPQLERGAHMAGLDLEDLKEMIAKAEPKATKQ